MIVAIIIVAVVVVLAFVVVLLRRRQSDPMDSFQRHIDALGPEARRPTIDRVHRIGDESGETDPDGS